MYSSLSVYLTVSETESVEEAVCGIYGQSGKVGYHRRLFVEQKMKEYLDQCVKDWHLKNILEELQGDI